MPRGTVVGTHRWPSQQLSPGFSGRLSSTSYSLSWKTVQRLAAAAWGTPSLRRAIRYPCRRGSPRTRHLESGTWRTSTRPPPSRCTRAPAQALLAALDDGWADPARLHREGRRAQLLLDQAREAVAAELGCRPDELSFTSSGTQAVHLAVLGAVQARQSAARGPGHLVASAVEHSSVLNAADWLARTPAPRSPSPAWTAWAGPTRPSSPRPSQRERTLLACLQSANHEVGTLQPVAEVAAACQAAGVPLLVDAAASAGRLPVPAGWSLLTASARKWGGPAGVGVLAVRKGTRWRQPLPADDRENRRVPGFPNVPAVLAAAASLTATGRERA